MATLTYDHQNDEGGSSVDITPTAAKAILDTLTVWEAGSADRHLQRVTYDHINGVVSISVRIENVDDISAFLTTINDGIDSLNSTHGTAFPNITTDDIVG